MGVRRLRERWLPADLWVIGAIVAAIVLIRPGDSPLGGYAFSWYAVVLVLVAVGGRRYTWMAVSSAVLAGVAGLVIAATNWFDMPADHWRLPYVVGGAAVAAISALQLVRMVRADRIDPVVLVAIQLAIGVVTSWSFELFSGRGLEPSTYAAATATSPFRSELPFLALALAAVGLGLSRDWRASAGRLGLLRPAWWQLVAAVLVATVFAETSLVTNILTYHLMPATYRAIIAVGRSSEGNIAVWLAILISLMAGLGEETLFRGALQPRVGILAAALLFALIHVQYGLSPILLMVFLHGIGYGLLRFYFNTTTAIAAHATYDLFAFLGPRPLVLEAIAIVVVIVLVVAALVSRDRLSAREISIEDWIGFRPGRLATP